MNINKVTLVGNVGQDPVLRSTKSGKDVTNLSVATNRRFRTGDGQWVEETDWHQVVLWGNLAKYVAANIRRGDQVFIEGRLSYRNSQVGEATFMKAEVVADSLIRGRMATEKGPELEPDVEVVQ